MTKKQDLVARIVGVVELRDVVPVIREKVVRFECAGKIYPIDMTQRRLQVYSRDNWSCVCCGLTGSGLYLQRGSTANKHARLHLFGVDDGQPIRFDMDHIVPKSRGGSDEPRNLQTFCRVCNELKSNRLISISDLCMERLGFSRALLRPWSPVFRTAGLLSMF